MSFGEHLPILQHRPEPVTFDEASQKSQIEFLQHKLQSEVEQGRLENNEF